MLRRTVLSLLLAAAGCYGTPRASIPDAAARDGDVEDGGGRCGDGHEDPGEACDQGNANSATAYGSGKCTHQCKIAPFCGDGRVNGGEACDGAGVGGDRLGDCNPECSGYVQKKFIRQTPGGYNGNLGGPSGADSICQVLYGAGWKALLVGGGRRATIRPNIGDGQTDWVVKKYTHYYNDADALVWRTDGSALLGVTAGQRLNVYADVWLRALYPWSGYDDDWVETPRNLEAEFRSGTCLGWTSQDDAEWGTFALRDLKLGAQEPCSHPQPLLCVEQ